MFKATFLFLAFKSWGRWQGLAVLGCIVGLLACKPKEVPPSSIPATPSLAIRGADLSFLPALRASGTSLLNGRNEAQDALSTLKELGMNVVRLRLWYQPTQSSASWQAMLALKNEIKAQGLQLLLSVHYSDTWADPAQQSIPAAWQALPVGVMADSVQAYTQRIMLAFEPDYIQIGNEINGGMLWPAGTWTDTASFHRLLRAGIAAVRSSRPATQIILHHAGFVGADDFYQRLSSLDYNVVGLSYYPMWHGKSLDSLGMAIRSLKQQTGKSVLVVETSYPFSLGWNDNTHNVVGNSNQLLAAYAATPAGQRAYLEALSSTLYSSGALGWCYWGAEWVSFGNAGGWQGSSWENQALWDFDSKLLPAVVAFSWRKLP